jgi:hypothetical protein
MSGILDGTYNKGGTKVLTLIRFKHVSPNYWNDKSNQLALLKDIEKELNIEQPTDWYRYGSKDIIKHGGGGLLRTKYNSSLSAMLQSLYPDVKWDLTKYFLFNAEVLKSFRFKHVPVNYWRNIDNVKEYIQSLAKPIDDKVHDSWMSLYEASLYAEKRMSILQLHRKSSLFHLVND